MTTTKKIHSGYYKVYYNNTYVGTIDKLEDKNEWICCDTNDKPFEICYSKKYALTQFN
jgi:hypothetical protein